MITGLNEVYINADECTMHIFDLSVDNIPQLMSKCILLKDEANKQDFNEILQKQSIVFLDMLHERNVTSDDNYKDIFCVFDKSKYPDVDILSISRKVKSRLMNISYFIANNGRIGLVDVLIMNDETAKEYDLVSGFNDMTTVINNHVTAGVIYLVRNPTHEVLNDMPGIVILINDTDVDNIKYAFAEQGYFPEKQMAKLTIVENKN